MIPDFALRIEQHLLGKVTADGVFQDWSGQVRRRFAITAFGEQREGELVLSEDFLFDDGATDHRVWRIRQGPGETYAAHADDMIGEARGVVRGGVLRWSYLFSLGLGARRLTVRFHDSFVRLGEDLLLNTAQVTKFGLPLGRMTILFRRP